MTVKDSWGLYSFGGSWRETEVPFSEPGKFWENGVLVDVLDCLEIS